MKQTRYLLALVLAFVLPMSWAKQAPSERKYFSEKNWSKLTDGDMVFIRSRSKNAALIAQLSGIDSSDENDAVFTHCGIVFRDSQGLKVLEGAGRGEVLTLADWQTREAKDAGHPNGEKPHNVYVRRWRTPAELTAARLNDLLNRAKALHDIGYDWGFSWTDGYAYCSELNWKAYHATGLKDLPLHSIGYYLEKLGSKGPEAEARLNRKEIKDVYRKGPDGKGKDVDRAETAVSPEDIYTSEMLVSVDDGTP